jgi:hypothetical protein
MKNITEHSGYIYQGYIKRKITKRFTVKEWNRFNKVFTKCVGDQEYYLDLQEYLCKRYNIILTDHINPVPMSRKILKWMKKNLTQENLDKGMKTFNDGVENFTKELDAFGKAFGSDQKETKRLLGISDSRTNHNKNIQRLTGSGPGKVKIWSDKPKRTYKKKRSRGKSRHDTNMEKIWGKRKRG